MDGEKLERAVKILKDAGASEVYLFGSQALGTAHADSDVDLGVRGLPPRQYFRMHWRLEDALDSRVDLVDFDFDADFYSVLDKIGELRKIG